MRLKIIRLIIISFFIFLTTGLFYIQVIRGHHYFRLSAHNRIRIVPLDSVRGRILDRHGVILADNRVSFDVFLVPQEIKNEAEIFIYLSQVLDIDREELWDIFKKRTIARFAPVMIAQDISKDKAMTLEENKFLFPGLVVQSGWKRYYPFFEEGCHVLGYISQTSSEKKKRLKEYGYEASEFSGYSGVEEYYDNFLKGQSGGLQIEVNHKGEQVRLLGKKEPISGQDLTLTVDARIQQIATQLLSEQAGAVIVLDLDTGDVLGMVSSPSFDPNVFINSKETKRRGLLFSDKRSPMLNRAIGGQYPPGSIFKIPVALAALDQKKISISKTFFCSGAFMLGQRQFRCTHAHGVQNFTQAIAHSCNVYFYNLGLILGPDTILDYARLFGLGKTTNIDLPHERSGFLPSPEHYFRSRHRAWSQGDTLNIAIGQGDILATPLQMVHMMGITARNGEEIYPRLLKAIGGVGLASYVKRSIGVPAEHFDSVKKGMRGAVEDFTGTARSVYIKDLKIFGKTGTAQSSGDQKSHAWFVGFCPEAKTRIVFGVFLEHGGSSYYACVLSRKLLVEMKKEKIL